MVNARRSAFASLSAKLLSAIVFAFTLADRADACQCVAISPCQALSHADEIFTGIVSDISSVFTPDGQGISGSVITIVADRGFVGTIKTGTVVLRTRLSSCDFPFRTGEQYLVYASRDSDGSLKTTICSRTKLLAEAGEDLAFLTALPPAGIGGQVSGIVERVQIDLLGIRRDEKLTAPASGVSVTIVGPKDSRRDAVTDADGRFQVSGLVPGIHRIVVNLPQTIRVQGDVEIRLADRGCAAPTIRLVSNGRIEGRVIDQLGDPVANALVSLMPAAFTNREEFPHAWLRGAGSNARGEFAFDGLPAGEYHLGVNVAYAPSSRAPYAAVWFPSVAARAETVSIRLSEGQRRTGLEIVVGERLREATVEGVVLMPDGTAARDAQVALMSPGSRVALAIGQTDAAGAFNLKGLERTAYTVEASQYSASEKTNLTATASVTPTVDEPVRVQLKLAPIPKPR